MTHDSILRTNIAENWDNRELISYEQFMNETYDILEEIRDDELQYITVFEKLFGKNSYEIEEYFENNEKELIFGLEFFNEDQSFHSYFHLMKERILAKKQEKMKNKEYYIVKIKIGELYDYSLMKKSDYKNSIINFRNEIIHKKLNKMKSEIYEISEKVIKNLEKICDNSLEGATIGVYLTIYYNLKNKRGLTKQEFIKEVREFGLHSNEFYT